MHFSVLVIGERILLKTVGDDLVVDHHLFGWRCRLFDKVKDVEELACVAPGKPEQRFGAVYRHFPLLQDRIHGQGSVKQLVQVVLIERLKHVDLRSRQKRADDFKRRVFGRCADQCDDSALDCSEQAVLLGFVEPVDFIDEQDGAPFGKHAASVGFTPVDDFAHLLDT